MNNTATLNNNVIDLSLVTSASNILHELSDIIERTEISNQKAKLLLGNILLTPAHLFGIKSLLETSGIEIEIVYTNSIHTQIAALGAGMAVAEQLQLHPIQKPEEQYQEIGIIQETEECSTEKILEEVVIEENKKENFKTENKESNTTYIKQTLRSGQTVNYNGNVVIIGDCHPGSEIIASGDITVWGVLSGIAHAGASGDSNTCIRALRINAIQLRIADFFARRPDKFEVEKNEKYIAFIPEEAKIVDGEILIYTLHG